jgi:hypothetical protein
MNCRTPGNIVAIKPMRDGVIADFQATEKMLAYFIQKAHHRRVLVHPRIVIGVPDEITSVGSAVLSGAGHWEDAERLPPPPYGRHRLVGRFVVATAKGLFPPKLTSTLGPFWRRSPCTRRVPHFGVSV